MSTKMVPLPNEPESKIDVNLLPSYEESTKYPPVHEGSKPVNNKDAFEARCNKLKCFQIGLGFLAVLLVQRRPPGEAGIEFAFLFLTFHSSVLTLIILLDGINIGALRKVLQLDQCWNRVELYYTGVVGLLMYSVSFWILATCLGYSSYPSSVNILAGAVGIANCLVYGFHWCLLFQQRMQLLEQGEI
ncbi:uncharacterized protein LOC134216172 [Armigeres subalbatus]|uniref:uncharacterized protein LOC134216172 n=1 Tax=Armigeres subalbatus TaxID=124917 RepID=UPI002ED416F4